MIDSSEILQATLERYLKSMKIPGEGNKKIIPQLTSSFVTPDGELTGTGFVHDVLFGNDTATYYVRFAATPKEVYVYKTFCSKDGLIPPPAYSLELKNAGEKRTLLLALAGKWFPEMTTSKLDELSMEWQASLIAELLAIELPSSTDGFGDFNEVGVAPFKSWKQFLLDVIDNPRRGISSDGSVAQSDVLHVYRELVTRCPEQRRLINGSLDEGYNVLLYKQKVVRVVDWSKAMFGDSVFDWVDNPYLMDGINMILQDMPENEQAEFITRMTCYELYKILSGVEKDGYLIEDVLQDCRRCILKNSHAYSDISL